MGIFKSKKGSIISNHFMVIEGDGVLDENTVLKVALYDDYLEFVGHCCRMKLEYSDIIETCYERKSKVKYEQKSVLGRAALGGMMFGGAGAVVGALTGLGTKPVTTIYYALGMCFLFGGERKIIWLEDSGLRGKQLAEKLREVCFLSKKS